MALIKKIEEDLILALKSGESDVVDVLRLVKTAFKNKEIEKRGKGEASELIDEDVLVILNREVKKRKEAIELFKKGNREDLVKKETLEIAILERYLPESLSREKIEHIVTDVIKSGTYEAKDFGLVMREVMKELRGKADGGVVMEIIKRELK
ncbi:MAG: hypothetical protein A3A04_02440 [Candidatus Harrisonbacteria bacterium RIFCSPLOWO2_01_FULL_40_28]|uniref:Glutamyl-tRNA amidotransferase n=2 Tax=Candidatus Harrisoniibacteriota TaxID=1817905 RepID=A0A1G1ZXL8_9BACT|nr:MAG: hypothetical protein A3A04_02440 [Candidatus Harrisonbacteria bacterium RIFCSPLOWO2_01_FULL_40_28]OGY69292.1 MAG: hypothetical protein A2586_01330 [Candidatus Harrisonbacteria bacterium RIFOXYD1_FULL_40_9]